MHKIIYLLTALLLASCTKEQYVTADYVDLDRFITKWYVIAGRFTPFEDEAYNPVEHYRFAADKQHIEVDFSFNKGSLDGERNAFQQRAWVVNTITNAHWKIRPFWPLKLNFLILAVADDYSWAAVGVPSQRYLWVMAKQPTLSQADMAEVLDKLNQINYSTHNLVYAQHN